MLNHFVGMGRIVGTPEMKVTQSGTNVTAFTIAIDRDYKSQSGEKVTDFLNVVAWRQTAEFVSRYFKKGSMICVEGSVNVRSYKDKDGNNRYVTEIIASQVHFTGEKQEQPSTAKFQNTEENSQTNKFEELSDQDDLPFWLNTIDFDGIKIILNKYTLINLKRH